MTTDVLIHANTGEDVGLGHVVRCLTLTAELQSRDIATELRLRDDEKAATFAREAGVAPTTSSGIDLSNSPADVVVVDSYDFTAENFERLSADKTLVVIDELGDRHIPADLVVNNNIYADQIDYPAAEAVLRGPEYCMLREPFRDVEAPTHHQPPESVLVTVGGADLVDSFVDVLGATAAVAGEATIDAVVGPYFNSPGDAPEAVVFHRDPPDIQELMWEADVAVSGGGQTLYELAACGTPAVALTLGADQVRNVAGFETAEFCLAAGSPAEQGFDAQFRTHLENLCGNVERRGRMSDRGRSLVDGNGVVRVADRLEEYV